MTLAVWSVAAWSAADLPPHQGLRILIVSDEVNPHGLSDEELTQPGDISAALLAPGNGLTLDQSPDAVVEVATNSLEMATELLSVSPGDPAAYDVLIYFAHRIPNNGQNDVQRQADFTAAVEQFLQQGGGMISFHHGSYLTSGKQGIQDLIGATASGSVPWNTAVGQNVINVAPSHFVTCNGVDYTGNVNYADPARGVPADLYPFFNNTPDERYLNFEINPEAEQIEVLFGSDYVQSGSTHLLGFTHRRAGWAGVVVGYQPGEYEPNALDVNGPNFQVLANAIVWAARRVPQDGVLLGVTRGPGPGDVTLEWSGCPSTFTVYRSTEANDVAVLINELGTTTAQVWIDTPPAEDLHFYLVVP